MIDALTKHFGIAPLTFVPDGVEGVLLSPGAALAVHAGQKPYWTVRDGLVLILPDIIGPALKRHTPEDKRTS